MKALLLAGGFGTRMRPLTERLPKPMAPVGNRPWLEHLIAGLKEQGIREIVIAVKHYPERIIDISATAESLASTSAIRTNRCRSERPAP